MGCLREGRGPWGPWKSGEGAQGPQVLSGQVSAVATVSPLHGRTEAATHGSLPPPALTLMCRTLVSVSSPHCKSPEDLPPMPRPCRPPDAALSSALKVRGD